MKDGRLALIGFMGAQYPAPGEPNNRSFDDFASGHSFDVFEAPKQVADRRLKLEHVMLTVVPRTAYRTFWLVRFSGQMACVFVYTKRYHITENRAS
jgi:hypothetical protein